MEAVVLHRVGFLEHFCAKQGQDFKPSAAPLYPNMGQVPPLPPATTLLIWPTVPTDLKPFWFIQSVLFMRVVRNINKPNV